jgi:hypothetical protein
MKYDLAIMSHGKIQTKHNQFNATGTDMNNWGIYLNKMMLTIFFWQWIIGISLAVRNNQILITCYAYVVRIAVRVPQLVIFKWCDKFTLKVPNCNWLIPESQEQL